MTRAREWAEFPRNMFLARSGRVNVKCCRSVRLKSRTALPVWKTFDLELFVFFGCCSSCCPAARRNCCWSGGDAVSLATLTMVSFIYLPGATAECRSWCARSCRGFWLHRMVFEQLKNKFFGSRPQAKSRLIFLLLTRRKKSIFRSASWKQGELDISDAAKETSGFSALALAASINAVEPNNLLMMASHGVVKGADLGQFRNGFG